MATTKKAETVEELVDLLGRSKIAILTDYRGLKVTELTQLRRKLKEAGIDFHIAKNTLTRLAAERVGKEAIGKALEGPTAIAFGFKDEVEPAKVLTDFIRTNRSQLKIKAGLLDKRFLGPELVSELATMPPREVMVGRVIGQMQAPIYGLVNVLSGNMRGLLTVLNARAQQLEGA